MSKNRGFEERFVEFRASDDGTEISGRAVTYGEEAKIASFRERFEPGSIQHDDVILNIQHDRSKPVARTGSGLTVTDSADGLDISAKLPDTVYGREARELVQAGLLRGLSVEFRTLKESWEGAVRVIQSAVVRAIAICDRPAYPSSTLRAHDELDFSPIIRMRQRGVIRGEINYGQPGVTSMARREAVVYEEGSIDIPGDVYLLDGGDYNRAIASTRNGALEVETTPTGLTFTAARLAATAASRDVRAKLRSGLLNGVTAGLFVREARNDTAEFAGERFKLRRIVVADLCELNLTAHEHPFSSI